MSGGFKVDREARKSVFKVTNESTLKGSETSTKQRKEERTFCTIRTLSEFFFTTLRP